MLLSIASLSFTTVNGYPVDTLNFVAIYSPILANSLVSSLVLPFTLITVSLFNVNSPFVSYTSTGLGISVFSNVFNGTNSDNFASNNAITLSISS